MSNDPDELKYDQAIRLKDPATVVATVEEIEVHLRYGISSLKLIGWVLVVLLACILWRVW
jgi:hypothetical protein